jgi:hypothetical protein
VILSSKANPGCTEKSQITNRPKETVIIVRVETIVPERKEWTMNQPEAKATVAIGDQIVEAPIHQMIVFDNGNMILFDKTSLDNVDALRGLPITHNSEV